MLIKHWIGLIRVNDNCREIKPHHLKISRRAHGHNSTLQVLPKSLRGLFRLPMNTPLEKTRSISALDLSLFWLLLLWSCIKVYWVCEQISCRLPRRCLPPTDNGRRWKCVQWQQHRRRNVPGFIYAILNKWMGPWPMMGPWAWDHVPGPVSPWAGFHISASMP